MSKWTQIKVKPMREENCYDHDNQSAMLHSSTDIYNHVNRWTCQMLATNSIIYEDIDATMSINQYQLTPNSRLPLQKFLKWEEISYIRPAPVTQIHVTQSKLHDNRSSTEREPKLRTDLDLYLISAKSTRVIKSK